MGGKPLIINQVARSMTLRSKGKSQVQASDMTCMSERTNRSVAGSAWQTRPRSANLPNAVRFLLEFR
jgi:hypothetical protein